MNDAHSRDRLEQLGRRWSFTDRPAPLPADLRPVWRIATILLVLHTSRGKSASLRKLHFATWALKDRDVSKQLIASLNSDELSTAPLPRIDPALNRAVDFAVAEGLVEISGKKSVKLSEKGLRIAKELTESTECLVQEKELLSELVPHLTEPAIDHLFKSLASS
ncbi:hypothetical protein WN982_20810 [Paraburkholderia sp. IMGN_8]|uniref:hypothetical protein n=1 Tax=Paraburkholderia sp. IMGN_8 TaxID=3136564 RepID=UPI003100FE8B